MTGAEIALITTIIDLMLKYGVPAAMEIYNQWDKKDEPTIEDIEALKLMVPRPETYFKGGE